MKYRGGNIHLSRRAVLNTVRYDSIDYPLSNLSKKFSHSKGGNSNVFLITNPADDEENAIKFCKYDLNNTNKQTKKRIARFSREVEALEEPKLAVVLMS